MPEAGFTEPTICPTGAAGSQLTPTGCPGSGVG